MTEDKDNAVKCIRAMIPRLTYMGCLQEFFWYTPEGHAVSLYFDPVGIRYRVENHVTGDVVDLDDAGDFKRCFPEFHGRAMVEAFKMMAHGTELRAPCEGRE
jgi:hypothetical protein